MSQKKWWLILPLAAVVGGVGWTLVNPTVTRGADGRIVDRAFLQLERKLGYHLYAPTWLPYNGRVGTLGTRQGARRIMIDFSDEKDRSLCILSQERRTPERDRYHQRIFVDRAEALVDVNGKRGVYVTGKAGERRLFWNEKETALILSSCILTDEELLAIARKVR